MYCLPTVSLYVYTSVPRASLSAGNAIAITTLRPTRVLGNCMFLASVRGCTPLSLYAPAVNSTISAWVVRRENYALLPTKQLSDAVLYTNDTSVVWSLNVDIDKETFSNIYDSIYIAVGGDGALRLVASIKDETETPLWTSASRCPRDDTTLVSDVFPSMRLDQTSGQPVITCPGGVEVLLS